MPAMHESPRVRVFISSTFHDMHEERDELVRRVFPRLRAWADSWEIDILELDLRWGIPDEPGVSALLECLRQVGECQPFFVGLLGHVYGSLMQLEQVDEPTLRAYPWLASESWDQHSYTELEFAQAILRVGVVPTGTLVYCRAAEYSRRLGALPEADSQLCHLKSQEQLREKARRLGAVRRSDYVSAVQVGEWIEEDIQEEIRLRFPDWFTAVANRRAGCRTGIKFGLGRVSSYAGQARLFGRLNGLLRHGAVPGLVVGEPGAGRTGLLQAWCMLLKGDQPASWSVRSWWGGGGGLAARVAATCSRAGAALGACLALGAAPGGITTGWLPVALRLLEALQELSGASSAVLPDHDPATLREAFLVCLQRWPEGLEVLICLDDADLLAGDHAADPLAWLPARFPDSVHVVVSMVDGARARGAARSRRWQILELPRLSPAYRRQIAETHFSAFGKRLGHSAAARIARDLPAASTLVLVAALEDLRFLQRFRHDTRRASAAMAAPAGLGSLEERLPELCAARDSTALLALVLASLRASFDQVQLGRDLAGDFFRLLACSRSGLAEAELLSLLGGAGRPLPTAHWLPLRSHARPFLTEYGGRFMLTRSAREEITAELLDGASERTARAALIDFFLGSGSISRRVEELPGQYRRLARWEDLTSALCDPRWLEVFWRERQTDLLYQWAAMASTCARPVEECVRTAYVPLLDTGAGFGPEARLAMLAVLQQVGSPLDAVAERTLMSLRREKVPIVPEVAQHLEAAWRHRLGEREKALKILETQCAVTAGASVATLMQAAQLHLELGRTGQAESDLARAEQLAGPAGASNAPFSMAIVRARLWLAGGEPKRALELARRLADRARVIGEVIVLLQAEGLAGRACLQLERWKAGLRHLQQEAEIAESVGDRHALQAAHGAEALVWQRLGNLQRAVPLLRQRYAICEALGDPLARLEVRRQFAALYSGPAGLRQPVVARGYLEEALVIALESRLDAEVAVIVEELAALPSA